MNLPLLNSLKGHLPLLAGRIDDLTPLEAKLTGSSGAGLRQFLYRTKKLYGVAVLIIGNYCAAQPFPEQLSEPGALYPGQSEIYFLVPEGEIPKAKNIRTLIVQSKVKRNANGKAIAENSLLDFDTGKPALFDYYAFKKATLKQRQPTQISGPVTDFDHKTFDSYYCEHTCFNEVSSHGNIDGEAVKIEAIELTSTLWGKPFEIQKMGLPFFDTRNRGYWALRAVTLAAQEKWAKVYLLQTEGTYRSPQWFEGDSNVVETISNSGVKYLLPGDKYFYLESDANSLQPHIQTGRYFGKVTIRVNLFTGMPVTTNPHIKAVDLREFQAVYDAALAKVQRHYPSEHPPNLAQNFFPQADEEDDGYGWTGSSVDIENYINFQFQRHFFKRLIK
jgi:hypothetical protein